MWVVAGTPQRQKRKKGEHKVPGSHEGFIMVRLMPAIEVPKACTLVKSERVQENSRRVCTFEPQPKAGNENVNGRVCIIFNKQRYSLHSQI